MGIDAAWRHLSDQIGGGTAKSINKQPCEHPAGRRRCACRDCVASSGSAAEACRGPSPE
jgi:hypothetical protein